MNKVFKKIDRKTWQKIIGVVVFTIAILAYLSWDVITNGPLTALLSDKERIIAKIQSYGAFAPLTFIFVQMIQTVLAPIPGQVVGSIGGYLFGWWGILWTVIGSAIGFFIVFYFSRKLGREIIEKIIKKEYLDKFDFVSGKHAETILFVIFLLPGLPDDIVCYVAGLTEVPIRRLMLLVIVGRLPAVISTNIFGASVGEKNLTVFVVMFVLLLIGLILIITYRERVLVWIKSIGQDCRDCQSQNKQSEDGHGN